MPLESLLQRISDSAESLIQSVQAGESPSALRLRRAARLPVLAALQQATHRPVLLLTDRPNRVMTVEEEYALWAPKIPRLIFREPNPLFYEDASWGETTRRDRLNALTVLASYHIPGAQEPPTPPLIIASARALMTRTLPRRDFLRVTRTLRPGQVLQLEQLVHDWVALGYEPTSTVVAPGQFARRGGILDLWPPAEPHPVRIEFFGDEIDTMRRFDPATQRTLPRTHTHDGDRERVLVTPAREYLLDRLSDEELNWEDVSEKFSEFHIPRLHPSPASILDYLPRQALVCIDDRQALEDTAIEIEEQAFSSRQDYIREGLLEEDFPIPYLSWSEILDSMAGHQTIQLGRSASIVAESEDERLTQDRSAEMPHDRLLNLAARFLPGPRFGGRLKLLIEHLVENYLAQEQTLIISRQSARLRELWAERATALPPVAVEPVFMEGSLSEGWTFIPGAGNGNPIHLLSDGEIFGWRRPEPRRRHRPVVESPESPYADLQSGDYVVHVDYGIGRFVGLVRRTVDGVEREYLEVDYADDAQLFVPVHQVDRLTRYVGPDGRPPSLSRLGGTEWRNVKSHVKEAVQEIAEDLLNLYATRNVVEGHAFAPDTPWQQELEASFPYIETEDQLRVLADVKRDMESERPMDRLICGDVGYGKTEIALRAAFKAVMDGKQVAVLVPTTVLAQQHYHTFTQRLSAFPVEVEMLSRFRTPQQQAEIVERLHDGSLDIVIGTHRLLSSDVGFKDLGLLIIDEEQRFGVTHKERLKQMRTEVDVLTLTATPIPRTLYMALSGVRDISTIDTPPEERLPIVTHVGPYSKRLIRQAILRELDRGGQVFFVHNRVQTIGAMRSHLKNLVPEARLTVAHGQMPENELSQRMEQFTRGEVDVLLSTSIIESGLDIPNANTLIVDRADMFGLAQLYQLRGRVGRGAQRAYAYFFRHKKRIPTEEGRQRLETIAENTQLGAGFSIAMRDLEIRGAGDILGTRQHGHIAAVGFHLYTRLLSEAVRKMRKDHGMPAEPGMLSLYGDFSLVNVELPLPISIPADYVPDKNVRLGLYRRMAQMRSLREVEALKEEFNDRFGPVPENVNNLLFQLRVKLLAEHAGLSSVTGEGGQLVLRFPEGSPPSHLADINGSIRVGKTALWMPYKTIPDWTDELLNVLQRLNRQKQT
ncbi:MAG: transcription-repair coupling factor [Anaerolineales bacterium]